MDSVFRPDLTSMPEWGQGRILPLAAPPCPVDELLTAYLPTWLHTFLADMWTWVS